MAVAIVFWGVVGLGIFVVLRRVPVIGMCLFGIATLVGAGISLDWCLRNRSNSHSDPWTLLIEFCATVTCGLATWFYSIRTFPNDDE